MKKLLISAILATILFAPNAALSESFYCARILHESFISSTGKLGVFLPSMVGENPRYVEVEPGECFYDEAMRDMRSMCAILNELPEGQIPPGAEDPSFEGPIDLNDPADWEARDSLDSIQKLKDSVAKLKKRVRTLRRKLHSKGSY